MAFVSVPKDLTKVKTKVALGLTRRQLVCFSAAAAVGVPVYFLTRGALGNSTAVILMISSMLPLFFFAMYERDGQAAERILRNIVRHRLLPGVRPYRTENLYLYLEKEGMSIAEQNETPGRTGAAALRRHPKGKGKKS
jgi:hypothetical protein